MQSELSAPHFLNQFFDPIDRRLVVYTSCYALVVLDSAVEYLTLITHKVPHLREDVGRQLAPVEERPVVRFVHPTN
jgi:hypothetical protein